MKDTDLRAKARAIFGPAIAEPMPNMPNGAKALQQRANARPIPTYKVGGPVKKMPSPGESVKSGNRMAKEEADEMRFMEMLEKKKRTMPSAGASVASGNRVARQEGAEMRKMNAYKKGGRVRPVEIDMKGLEEASRPKMSMPKADLESKAAEARNVNAVRGKETTSAAKGKSFKEAFAEARREQGANGVFTWRGNTYNTKMAGEDSKPAARPAAPAPTRAPAAAPASRPASASSSAAPPAPAPTSSRSSAAAPAAKPEPRVGLQNSKKLTDLLSGIGSAIGRGISSIDEQMAMQRMGMSAQRQRELDALQKQKRSLLAKAEGGKVQTSSDTARKLATEMGGMKKGGKAKPKDGLAVMIAIGKAKPAKKMNGGPMAAASKDMESSKVTREMAMGGAPMGYAAGGAGKMRKGQAPIKKAQGGAAKVRKGMMTPEGKIIDVMNKMRGK